MRVSAACACAYVSVLSVIALFKKTLFLFSCFVASIDGWYSFGKGVATPSTFELGEGNALKWDDTRIRFRRG